MDILNHWHGLRDILVPNLIEMTGAPSQVTYNDSFKFLPKNYNKTNC